MADATILREYLVALGFKVNEPDAAKFDKRLAGWDKRATMLGRGLISVGVAAQAMVTQFAFSMEKLYYASRRTDSAVGSIQALDYGFRRIGGSSETIKGSLESLARNLRSNPGLTGLLQSLGVEVKGRDKADVLMDLVTQLKKMPFYVAERFANMFGIDPDTLFMLQDGLDEMKRAQAERKQLAADMGLDTEAAALAGKEYANSWREIMEYVGIFRDTLAIALLPKMQEFSGVVKEVLKDWTAIAKTNFDDFGNKLAEGLGVKGTGGGVRLTPEARERLGLPQEAPVDTAPAAPLRKNFPGLFPAKGAEPGGFRALFQSKAQREAARALAVPPSRPAEATETAQTAKAPPAQWLVNLMPGLFPKNKAQPTEAPKGPVPEMRQAVPQREQKQDEATTELFRKLEAQYALPAGMLDRIWRAESNRGDPRFMKSKVGAEGHFGFMPATAKEEGVKDPYDLQDSAKGAARYMSKLLKRYDGDARTAAAAYNWGLGNVDRFGLGRAPEETRDYMDRVGGRVTPTLTQTNHITITGASDPQSTARAVGEAISDVNSDAIRNFTPKVQ